MFISLACTMVVAPVVAADPAADNASFDQHVRPILARYCSECHSADSPELGLDLSSAATALRGSESGAVVLPGKASDSLLVKALAKDADPHMPPDGQLSPPEIKTITTWIDGLDPATSVGGQVTAKYSEHWSFQPVTRPAVPAVENPAWCRTPIDRFILSRLEAESLSPNPPADKATLLRRIYFDLVGLPPTPKEVQAFVEDDSPDACERVVERLLASPGYGERWGRHWLDLARYADSSGFHNDIDRPNAWRYRDYVIDSFNADKPYGRFIREQLAGDELPDATLQSWIATGFCRNGPSNDDNMGKTELAREQYRMDQLDDVISTTSNVFLGLTIGCARCHDHKYDPLTQRDYYQLLAFFDTAQKRQLAIDEFRRQRPKLMPVSTKSNSKSPGALVLTDYGKDKPRTTRLLWRGDVQNPGPAVQPNVPDVLAGESSSPMDSSRLALADWIADGDNPLTWRVMANRLWHYHFGRGLVSSPSNFGRLGERPTHPQLLDWLAAQLRDGGGSLKAMHRLIVTSAVYRQSSQGDGAGAAKDPDNRLWWRMDKRRLEAEPLRDAYLSAADNLNLQMGGPGIQPRIRPDLLEASQRNKWPVVKREGPEHWRRGVYVYVKRQLQLPMLELFDAPSSTHSCPERDESLVPTQALVLLNDDFVREQAACFADRVARDAGDDPAAQVKTALWIALSRPPGERRSEEGVAFLESQTRRLVAEGQSESEARRAALADFCHVLMNLSEFVYVD